MGKIRIFVEEVIKPESGYEHVHTTESEDKKVIAKTLRAIADSYDPPPVIPRPGPMRSGSIV